jgi:hypothetical protein
MVSGIRDNLEKAMIWPPRKSSELPFHGLRRDSISALHFLLMDRSVNQAIAQL